MAKSLFSKWLRRALLGPALALLLYYIAAAPFPADSFEGLASPQLFAIARWEAGSLWRKAQTGLTFWRWPPGSEAVRAYLQGGGITPGIEQALEAEIALVLREEGILPLPPPLLRFDTPPNVLLLSPRSRIELLQSFLLRSQLTIAQMEDVERRVEAKGVSALVEGVGGVAMYPSLVLRDSEPKSAVETIAHEWLHQYFFFRPLGRHYGSSYEMAILNESAAEIAGKEMARQVLKRYGIEASEAQPAGPSPFDREMRQIRQEVDRLLSAGQIDAAERFMEESRLRLIGMGYSLRKLNQAYFAFHGSYAGDPAATSPIGEELKRLRGKSASLGEFIKRVASLSSYKELQRLVY